MTALEGLFAEDVVSYSDGGRLVRAAGAHPQTPLSWPPDAPRVAQRKFGGFQTVVSAPPKLASGNGQVGPHLVFFEVSQCRLRLVLLSQRSRALRVRAISESAPVHGVHASVHIARKNGQAGAGRALGDQILNWTGLYSELDDYT